MERRKFLIGAGSAAIGSSALIGSGAFSSVRANREVTVNVANDSDAYLGLTADDEYVSDDSGDGQGQLTLDFGGPDDLGEGNGDGFNDEAITDINDVIKVTNQGTNTVGIGFPNGQGGGRVRKIHLESARIDLLLPGGSGSPRTLEPGQSVDIDVTVDTTDDDASGNSATVQIRAKEK